MSDEQKAKISKANTGRKLTPEHVENLRKSHLGQIPTNIEQLRILNTGRSLTEDHKRKIGVSNLGKKRSEETRRKISQGKKGKKLSLEHIQNLKGRTPWNKDKKGTLKHTEEYKAKKRDMFLGKNNPNYGKFGKDHSVWKDKKKRPFAKLLRSLHEYKEWRSEIFKRDNWTCVLCKATGYVEADHFPKRFADILKEFNIETLEQAMSCEILWDTKNGRTLCKPCHNPTRGRYKKS